MNKRNKDVKKFNIPKVSKTNGKRRTEKYKSRRINDQSVGKQNRFLLTKTRNERASKVKATSKVKFQNQPTPTDTDLLTDQKDARDSLSSNWKEFMKVFDA